MSTDPGHVVDFWGGKDETGDGVQGWIIKIVLLTIAVTCNWPADNRNAKSEGATTNIFFITVGLTESS